MQIVHLLFRVIIVCLTAIIPGTHSLNAQAVYGDYTFGENIKSVQMHVRGWEMSYPVIELGSQDELVFSFDDLDGDVKNYQYSIVLCNADWTPSTLFQADYIDGFYENQLDNYSFSFNTFIPYTHYSLSIPNNDVGLKLPGNYVITVYKDFDADNVVLTRRFMISEQGVNIEASVHRPQLTLRHNTAQQVTIRLLYHDLAINDPYSELVVRIIQNGRKDTGINDIKPTFIRPGEIIYEHEADLVFPALNEFRNFDTKSLRYQTEFIKNIDFFNGLYHVELHPSPSRQFGRYFFHNDINGRFLIRNEEGRDPATDADYVMVYFTLPWDVPVDNGNVYVMGALSNWNFDPATMMTYNYESKAYELDVLLKQGYYNYHFVYLQDGASTGDASLFEGNYFETENDYFIMVYHRAPGSRFDRLVGTKQVNSGR